MSTIPSPTEIEVGDHVITPSGSVHWSVERIFSKIDPLGVLLASGMTGRKRYEDYGNLVLFQKGAPPVKLPQNRSAVADLLRESGIDPADVLEDGLTAEGYKLRTRTTGAQLGAIREGDVQTVWREWPTPEFGRHVMNIYRGEI